MIVTVTPNPSFDHTYQVSKLEPGAVVRADRVTVEAAGKGVNVARNLAANGAAATALFAATPGDGKAFREELAPVGVHVAVVHRPEPARRNITVLDHDGSTTKINERGAALDDAVVASLIDALTRVAGGVVAACGSLAPGTPDDLYVRIGTALVDPGTALAIDTSGAPLRAALDIPCLVAKPNRAELEELLETRFTTYGELVDAARDLNRRGWAHVLVSLGPQGAVLVNDDGVWAGSAPTSEVANTVGAGDALLSGFLAERSDPETGLMSALAFAHATVRSALTAGAAVRDADRRAVHLRPIVATESLGEETG